ncbi:MAG TPA: UDP-3-O-(3-hydroxymyristoyl)glucosamine N-acyltransferase [Gemmatimonadaceae bacterium]|nr:UDP-3-O-(3-hydroxymyristoyl)glucosamine N-acyltransferase [Gemmatimonadaceae bacterium]
MSGAGDQAAPHDAISPAAVLTAGEIARLVGGELRGDAAAEVVAVAPLHRAGPRELSFLASPRYTSAFTSTKAAVVLVSPELADVEGEVPARVVVARPHDAVLTLLPRLYRQPDRVPGVDPTARIGLDVRLGADVTIGAFAVIGDGAVIGDRAWVGEHCVVGAGVEIGDDSRLFPHVTCYPGAVVGRRVMLHSGVRVASDGFGYVWRDGHHAKIPHVGRCIIGDDVEVGANTTLDRGSVDDTIIGAGTKIDNLVQIAHNVHVGRLCLIVSQAGIAGSTHIEDGCVLGGQVGVGGHVTIGAGARVAARAGVFGDVPAGETWSGYPARPHRESLRASAALLRLPEFMRRVERLLQGGAQ